MRSSEKMEELSTMRDKSGITVPLIGVAAALTLALSACGYPRDSIPSGELEEAFAALGDAGWEASANIDHREIEVDLYAAECDDDLDLQDNDSLSCDAPQFDGETGLDLSVSHRTSEGRVYLGLGDGSITPIELDNNGELILDLESIGPDEEIQETDGLVEEDPED